MGDEMTKQEAREMDAIRESNAETNRQIDAAKKRTDRRMDGVSKYGRKHAYLSAHGGWGWEYPHKPWL